MTGYHPCGTARMGRNEEAPVAPDLRLRGVEGLPAIVSGNTNAAVLVVAERAAEFILGRVALSAAAVPEPA